MLAPEEPVMDICAANAALAKGIKFVGPVGSDDDGIVHVPCTGLVVRTGRVQVKVWSDHVYIKEPSIVECITSIGVACMRHMHDNHTKLFGASVDVPTEEVTCMCTPGVFGTTVDSVVRMPIAEGAVVMDHAKNTLDDVNALAENGSVVYAECVFEWSGLYVNQTSYWPALVVTEIHQIAPPKRVSRIAPVVPNEAKLKKR